jgi:hypothetical protein
MACLTINITTSLNKIIKEHEISRSKTPIDINLMILKDFLNKKFI